MQSFRWVVMGGSTGSFDAVEEVFRGLAAPLPLPLVVVTHPLPFRAAFRLQRMTPGRLERPVPARFPRAGVVYLGQPGLNLHVRPSGHFALFAARSPTPTPTLDALFGSAAQVYGQDVLAIVLSGHGRDGVDGAVALRAAGARVVVQEPATAASPHLPEAVLAAKAATDTLTPDAIASLLASLPTTTARR